MAPAPAQQPKEKHRAALDAVAGGLAGAVARVVVGPLDVLKIRFQVQLEPIARAHGSSGVSKYTGLGQALATIVREEGVQGLWRGTVPGLLLTIPYTAVQFVALQQCREFAARHGLMTGDRAYMLSFVSGAVAGASGTVASYPFDLLRTTLAAQGKPPVYRGMLDAARGVVAQQGLLGLYSGLSVTLLEIVPYAALQFGLYDLFTAAAASARTRVGAEEPGPGQLRWERFLCGLAAGTLAKLGTHPLDVCKKRFQVAGLQRSIRYGARVQAESVRSIPACMAAIWQREGMRGLYKGALPSVLKAAPSSAVTLSAYECFLGLLTAWAARRQSEQQLRS